MSCLITNLPSVEVWVRKEYLTVNGEFGCRPSRCLDIYYAAMYDKLPISAFLSEPVTPDPDMNLPNLQFWNCMDYGVVSVTKQFIGSMDFECYTRDYGIKRHFGQLSPRSRRSQQAKIPLNTSRIT